MKRCIIVAGGDYAPIRPLEGDFVIACDRGIAYCIKENIVPDLVMGDFDSYSGHIPEGVPVERFRAEKDDTDTMLAIRKAAALGFDALRIACGFGGRMDHFYANIQSLVFAVKAGMEAEMEDENTYIRVLRAGEYSLPDMHGRSLSLFAIGEACTDISLSGTKYELEGGRLDYSFPLGVSNEIKGEGRLSFRGGPMLLMCCRKED